MQAAVRTVLDALSGSEPAAASGRRPSSTLLGAPTVRTAPSTGATLIDTTGLASGVSAWTQEREVRQLETTKLRTAIGEAQDRLSAAKKTTMEAQKRLEADRAERSSLEHWFTRQVGTRTAAVEDARKEVRRTLVSLARQALADRAVFGAEVDPAREQIGTLERAAESAARDVVIHEAALEAYDPPSLRTGVVLLGVAAVLALALLVAPIVWRATRVIEAPPPVHSAQPH